MEMGSERSVPEFIQGLYWRLGSLLPCDLTICSSFYEVNPFGVREILGLPEKSREEFIRHFSLIYPPEIPLSGTVNWNHYQQFEFTTDFVKPLGFKHSCGGLLLGPPDNIVHFTVHRSPCKSGFTEQEQLIMNILFPHLKNLFNYLNIISGLKMENIDAAGCRLLSKREAEIATLLCKRLNAAEIATLLLISPRTVERHIINIYEKMKVRNRRELILKLHSKK